MANRRTKLSDRIKEKLVDEPEPNQGSSAQDQPGGDILDRHFENSRQVTRGERVKKVLYNVPPASCRMWAYHNRDYDLLSEQRCADLIQGFRSSGGQEFPAIVRRVEGEGAIQYEVICGARRHWTATYLGWDLLVEVRDLSDEEAFRLADVENRDREDISDIERAQDYARALEAFYGGNQKQMAVRMGMSESKLSRLLSLKEMPAELVEAFPSKTEIKVSHWQKLARLMVGAAKKKISSRAKEIKGQGLDAKAVMRELEKAGKEKRQGRVEPRVFTNAEGRQVLAMTRKQGGNLVIAVQKKHAESKEEIKKLLGEAIDEAWSE